MQEELRCYRCGELLLALTPPISRRDACPACLYDLHVCRMCVNFARGVQAQCREDDAEEVFDKEKQNFCDWYKPSMKAFDPARQSEEIIAKKQLAALFGEDRLDEPGNDESNRAAEDLFR